MNLGAFGEAEEAIRMTDYETLRCEVKWAAQWGKFYIADILWLLGRHEEAITTAVDAGARAAEPPTPGLAGTYSRWSVLVACREGACERQLRRLEKLRENRERLDTLDRAELDCALVLLTGKLGIRAEVYEKAARNAVAELPVACTQQLRSFGLLVDTALSLA